MDRTTNNAASSFEQWSVTGWSFTFQLLTLNLMDFRIPSKEKDEKAPYRAICGFIRPSRTQFSKFQAKTDAIIQNILVSPNLSSLTTYRLEFKNNSFIEIDARECSAIQW
jgi:hypothetical protein